MFMCDSMGYYAAGDMQWNLLLHPGPQPVMKDG